MSGKQPKRQKCQPKVYTESDFRKALREAVYNVGLHNMKLNIASFALALHRHGGMDQDRMTEILSETAKISNEALCYTDVKEAVMQETGLDIDEFIESRM